MSKIVYCENCKYAYIKDLVCGECEKKNKIVRPWDYCGDGDEVALEEEEDTDADNGEERGGLPEDEG